MRVLADTILSASLWQEPRAPTQGCLLPIALGSPRSPEVTWLVDGSVELHGGEWRDERPLTELFLRAQPEGRLGRDLSSPENCSGDCQALW